MNPTMTAPVPQQEKVATLTHTTVVGHTRFWCIQPDCDGKHHFYCDRQHRAA